MKHNWQYKKLGEVGEVITGSTPDTSIKEYYNSPDFMFVKPGDINENGITQLKATESYVSAFAFNKCCRKLPTNSILVTCIGTLGKVGILAKEATCNQQINAIIPNNCSAKFLAYAILSIRSALISKKNGPVVPIINKSRFSNFTIPVPPLEEQQRIVAELDRINGVMEDCRQLLRTLDTLAQSLFYDSFGDPISNPKAWPTDKLGEINTILSAKRVLVQDVVETGIPFIRGTELAILSKQISFDKSVFSMFITEEHYQKVKAITGVPTFSDLLIPSINPDGNIWEVNTSDPFYFKDGRVLWIKVNHEKFESKWLRFALTNIIKEKYANLSRGAVFTELTLVFLRNLELPLPPLELQQQFARRIEAIEAQKKAVEKTIATLQTLLDSRMDYWFN